MYTIGMRSILPTNWVLVEYDDYYDGSDREPHGEIASMTYGEAKGINNETNEIITSNVKIKYYTPMFIDANNEIVNLYFLLFIVFSI